MVVARMSASLHRPRSLCRTAVGSMLRYLISEIQCARMTEDYKGRIGNLIRDARKHRGLDPAAAGRAARPPARAPSTGSRRATRTSPWRCSPASARRSTPRSSRSAPGPTHLRVTGPTTLSRHDRRQDLQERRRRAAVRLAAQPRAVPRCARSPGSRRSTGCSRCSSSIGVQTRWLNDDNDLEIIPPRGPRPEQHRRGRGPSYPLDHHVPRPAAAPHRRLRAALRRRLQPRHPHRRAAHGRAAPVRPARSRRPTGSYHASVNRAIEPGAPDRAHRAR